MFFLKLHGLFLRTSIKRYEIFIKKIVMGVIKCFYLFSSFLFSLILLEYSRRSRCFYFWHVLASFDVFRFRVRLRYDSRFTFGKRF